MGSLLLLLLLLLVAPQRKALEPHTQDEDDGDEKS
jgi:hypothetical protein